MIRCQSCGKRNPASSRFCDECGTRVIADDIHNTDLPSEDPHTAEHPVVQGASITSVGVPPIVESLSPVINESNGSGSLIAKTLRASLIVERGEATGTEFILDGEESYI